MITPFRSPRLRSVNRTVLLGLTGAGLFLASLDAYVGVTALLPMLKSVNIAVNRPEQATPIITGFLLGYLAVMPVAGAAAYPARGRPGAPPAHAGGGLCGCPS